MKIVFLEIDTDQPWALTSVGPGHIASFIRPYGHDASLLRISPEQPTTAILQGLDKEEPDVLGISMTTNQWHRARFVAEEIRKNIDLPTIAGGLHPTFAPVSVLEAHGIDAVCLGEGEEAVNELLSFLENGGNIENAAIANIWIKNAPRPVLRPPIPDLNQLPFIARDMLDEQHGIINITTQRGCPFQCSFCAGGAINALYEKSYIRRRPVSHVIAELQQIRKAGALNYVVFLDDTFTVNKGWIDEFCTVYGKKFSIPFSINGRVETVTKEMISRLKDAGCRHIIFGVESGSLRVRKEILNRPVEDRQIIEAFHMTKDGGMLATANYMLGIPGETPCDIKQTLALHKRLEPDDFGYFVFYPYPGTPLHTHCRKKGYLPENYLDFPATNSESILNLPDLSDNDIKIYYNKFTELREQLYEKRYGKLAPRNQQQELS